MWKVLSSVQVLVCVLLLCACSADPRFESAPTITANPVESVPLIAFVDFTTNEPTKAVLKLSDGDQAREISFPGPAQTVHRLPVLGMRPDTFHRIEVVAVDSTGQGFVSDQVLQWTTPSYPESFPKLTTRSTRSRKPELMEPTDGGRIRDSEGHFADFGPDRTFSARILKVTHTEEPEVVFDVAVEGRSRDEGWVVPEQPLPQSLSLGRRMSHLVPLV